MTSVMPISSNKSMGLLGKGIDRTAWVAWLFYQGKATQSETFGTTVFPKMHSSPFDLIGFLGMTEVMPFHKTLELGLFLRPKRRAGSPGASLSNGNCEIGFR